MQAWSLHQLGHIRLIEGVQLRFTRMIPELKSLTLSLRNYFLGLTEFKYGIFNYVLVILLSFSYYFR